ncbi:MAG: fibrobacter succinogenes major paralogous domain-containing protein [Bacteroidetes bacterium]|nr:fibrobacter succinogenes major paralogous domain-containing protein [Bacteroidota bacterium]
MKGRYLFVRLFLIAFGIALFSLLNQGCKKSSDTSTGGITPPPAGMVQDVDGNNYHTVTIGTQTWLVENLKVTHYRNGDAIVAGTSVNKGNAGIGQGAFWNYGNKDSLGKIYGRLYNYYALIDSRFLAPLGWRVASNSDWNVLANFLGADSIAGGKLKESGTLHWANPNIGATNSSGFTALPGGNYNSVTHFFSFLGYGTSLWTSTEIDANEAYACSIFNNSATFNHGIGMNVPKFGGLSVRCVKE